MHFHGLFQTRQGGSEQPTQLGTVQPYPSSLRLMWHRLSPALPGSGGISGPGLDIRAPARRMALGQNEKRMEGREMPWSS